MVVCLLYPFFMPGSYMALIEKEIEKAEQVFRLYGNDTLED